MHLFKKKNCDNKIFLAFSRNMSVPKVLVNCDPLTFYWNKTNPKEKDSHSWGVDGGDVETICDNTVDSFRNTTPKHLNHTLPCNISLFKQLTSVVGMCDLGARWSPDEDLRARQCLHWLVFDHPPLSSSHHEKKRCWLLTGQLAFSCWVEFKPWFE